MSISVMLDEQVEALRHDIAVLEAENEALKEQNLILLSEQRTARQASWMNEMLEQPLERSVYVVQIHTNEWFGVMLRYDAVACFIRLEDAEECRRRLEGGWRPRIVTLSWT